MKSCNNCIWGKKCHNSHLPTTCKKRTSKPDFMIKPDVMCSHLRRDCDKPWASSRTCDASTKGKVKDTCRLTCNNCPDKKYTVDYAQPGSMSCPEEFVLVTDKEDCQRSAAYLGQEFKGEGCFSTEIVGCIFAFIDNGPFISFSTCSSTHDRDYAGVCKRIK